MPAGDLRVEDERVEDVGWLGNGQQWFGSMLAASLGLALRRRGWGWGGSRWSSGRISGHRLPGCVAGPARAGAFWVLGVVAAARAPFVALPAEPGDRFLVLESDMCIGANVLLIQVSESSHAINIIHKYPRTRTIPPVALTFS